MVTITDVLCIPFKGWAARVIASPTASLQGPAAPIPTRPKASYICSSSGRAVEQTANLRG